LSNDIDAEIRSWELDIIFIGHDFQKIAVVSSLGDGDEQASVDIKYDSSMNSYG
jgi:hypothetical protein